MHPPWPEITRSTGTFRTFRSKYDTAEIVLRQVSCWPQPKDSDTGIVRYRYVRGIITSLACSHFRWYVQPAPGEAEANGR